MEAQQHKQRVLDVEAELRELLAAMEKHKQDSAARFATLGAVLAEMQKD